MTLSDTLELKNKLASSDFLVIQGYRDTEEGVAIFPYVKVNYTRISY